MVEDENCRFRITCNKFEKYESGAQIFIPYGKYSNRQLLTNYGFVLKDNHYNYARIKINLGEFMNENQAESIAKGFSLDLPVIFKLKFNEFSCELLRIIRGFLWDINRNPSISFFSPIDLELEIAALEKFVQLLKKRYAEFPTSIEQDLEILQKDIGKKLYFAVFYS